jgi:hypothetical protein
MARLAGSVVVSVVMSVVVFVVVFFAVARHGCDEQASCRSFLGNGTADWPYVVPLLIAAAAGSAAFALLGALGWFWRTYSADRDEIR